ncbi:MAG: pantoate--beta-alanine ligase [Candidatus Aminicenantia bacterium]
MEIFSKIEELKKKLGEEKRKGKSIGFVPTMGYLHEGHLSLVRQSIKETDVSVVSIFVNPIQFGPGEDFNRYPRDIDSDIELLEKEGVNYLFYPDNDEMYPKGYKTFVEVNDLGKKLCGKSRPGHFKGVTTVVLKLFNIVKPDRAYFGQKDAQQAIIIKKMIKDLNLDIDLVVMPIVREKDGLAMSSRNVYLNEEERTGALVLYKSLKEAEKMILEGERDAVKIIEKMRNVIIQYPKAVIDYIEIVDTEELESVNPLKGEFLIALAVYIGKARLIDNIIMEVQ